MDPNDCREKGNDLVKEGKMEEALLCYSSGLVFSPSDHRLLSNRSLVLCKLGKYTEALKDAETCINVHPKWSKGYLRKCVALIYLGQFNEAEKSAEKGYLLQHDRRLSKDLVSQWLIAREHLCAPILKECIFELPTGTKIMSEKYYIVLLKIIQARLSVAGGMSSHDMGHCLLAICEEVSSTLEKFGVQSIMQMQSWCNVLWTEPDPQSVIIPDTHHSMVIEKTKEFVQWLNDGIDDLLYPILRPFLALAFLTVSTRSWVLQNADAGAFYVALLMEGCFPLFETAIFDSEDYIGYHIGALSGYLGSFIGRDPSFSDKDVPVLSAYCQKMESLLEEYPKTAMEYEDVKYIAVHNLGMVKSMLEKHCNGVKVPDKLLPTESVVDGHSARRLAKTKPLETREYIQKMLRQYSEKPAVKTTVDDAKNLVALSVASLQLDDDKSSLLLLQYGEQAYVKSLMYLIFNETINLDEATYMITTARQDILLVALLLYNTYPDLYSKHLVDVSIRWKGLYSELRACLTQLGHGENCRKIFLEINKVASSGNHDDVFYDMVQQYKRKEREVLRKYFVSTLNTLFLQNVNMIQKGLAADQLILDYTFIVDHYDPHVETVRGFLVCISHNSDQPIINTFDSLAIIEAMSKWKKTLEVDDRTEIVDFAELPGKKEAAHLSSLLFPLSIKKIIMNDVNCIVVVPADGLMGSLPLDLLPLQEDKSIFETHTTTVLTSPRELIRTSTVAHIMEMQTKDSHEEIISKDFKDLSMSDEGVRQFLPSTMYTIEHLSQVEFSEFGKGIETSTLPEVTSKPRECYLIANPNYDLENSSSYSPSLLTDALTYLSSFFEITATHKVEQLPMSQKEVENVELILQLQSHIPLQIHPPVLLDDATLSFIMDIQSPYLLHISTHGSCETKNWNAYHGNIWSLNQAALMLAGANTYLSNNHSKIHPKAGIGCITALGLSGVDLKDTNLVFLSACISAHGNSPIQEAVASLVSSARVAGASTVIGTLWTIFDIAAVKFSSYFYNKLCSASGVHPSEALAVAKREMKANGDHWYNWAAYVSYGLDYPFIK